MTEIEQLRADIATLEAAEAVFARKYGQTYQRYNIELDMIRKQLARLEKEAADPWHEAKTCVSVYEDSLPDNKRLVAKYVRYLEAELAKRPVVWCVLREGGYLRRRCGCVKTFTDRDKRSSSITETSFRPYIGEQE